MMEFLKRNTWLKLIALLMLLSVACGGIGADGGEEAVVLPTPTRTPQPTFTPSPTPALVVVPTNTPLPTATPTPEVVEVPTDTPEPTPSPTEVLPTSTPLPQARVARDTVNLRNGPGTAYGRLGVVNLNDNLNVLGRNDDGSWFNIRVDDTVAWIYAPLVEFGGDVNALNVVDAPAPPPQVAAPPPANPAPSNDPPPPPPPAQSQYPFSIVNVFGQTNEAITQIRGYIGEASNPGVGVNGVRVRVRSGSFCTVSVPSGTAGVYPAGNYDILLDTRAKPGNWQVAIVDKPTNPEDNSCDPGAQLLSQEISVPTTEKEGVVFVEYARN